MFAKAPKLRVSACSNSMLLKPEIKKKNKKLIKQLHAGYFLKNNVVSHQGPLKEGYLRRLFLIHCKVHITLLSKALSDFLMKGAIVSETIVHMV